MSANRALVAHHFDDMEQQHAAASLGMWVFLATEILIFGALFTGYFAYRSSYSADFEAGSAHLNILIGGINTVVLLASSLTMALSVHAAQTGQRRQLLWCLALTALFGTLFMVFKALEYYGDYRENLVPGLAFDDGAWLGQTPAVNPRHVKLFLAFYYILTGLHAIHLTIGIGLILVLLGLAWQGHFPPEHYTPIEVSGLYWHFVDVVWIFLLPILYLIGTHTLAELHF